ncbi:hypothetical protein GCM10009117_16100 [Gangjinia marincola]|uniref:Nitroreductase domain-containing protein n=1 Tax=Gangjinia marincola TaxID=578463 RepID=A0ABN1MH07_9FLAO
MIEDSIKSRRSVFPAQYDHIPIPREIIEKALEMASWAPTHKKTEPWRFKVFHSALSKKDLSEFLSTTYQDITPNFSVFKQQKISQKVAQSGCVIAICMKRDPKEVIPEWEEIAAVAMAVQNMWLYCSENGVGCYWSSPKLMNYLHEHVTMEDGERCLGFFYMGMFSGESLEGQRTSIEAKTTWV